MPTSLATDLSSAAPLRSDPSIAWLGIADWLGVSVIETKEIFERKHGYPPQEQRPAGPILLVGPIEEEA